MTGSEVESPPRLKATKSVTGVGEYSPGRHKNPSRLRKCRLHTLHETTIVRVGRARAEFQQHHRAQMLDGSALEQNVLMTTGIEPIDVDVGVDDDATHSLEDFSELSLARTLPECGIDIGLRHDEREGPIQRLRFGPGRKHFSSFVELSLI